MSSFLQFKRILLAISNLSTTNGHHPDKVKVLTYAERQLYEKKNDDKRSIAKIIRLDDYRQTTYSRVR